MNGYEWECESGYVTDTWTSESATLWSDVIAYDWHDGGEAMEYRITLYKKGASVRPFHLPELRMLALAN